MSRSNMEIAEKESAKEKQVISTRISKKIAHLKAMQYKEEIRSVTRKIQIILRKQSGDRTESENLFLQCSPKLVEQVKLRMNRREIAKARLNEVEDSADVLSKKCKILAEAIKSSNCTVVYTGAGISTAASIPDYRGPNGVWTLLSKGLKVKSTSLLDAEPTFTHMALTTLQRRGIIYHITSQNCDGLHLRSGFPRKSLSELHGNMYIEVCTNCDPEREYIRLFDVTVNTSFRRHKTGNFCDICHEELQDTIVHFGEKGKLESPLNWSLAAAAAEKCDLILCLGSSLKVLKKYQCLWALNRPMKQRPKLYVVNLQWTPKDDSATLKINGKCDTVMMEVMKNLKISTTTYTKQNDPIFHLSNELKSSDNMKTRKRLKKCTSLSSFGTHLSDHNYVQPCDKSVSSSIITDNKTNSGISSFSTVPGDCVSVSVKKEIADDDLLCDDAKHEDEIIQSDNNPGWFGKGCLKGRAKRKKVQ